MTNAPKTWCQLSVAESDCQGLFNVWWCKQRFDMLVYLISWPGTVVGMCTLIPWFQFLLGNLKVQWQPSQDRKKMQETIEKHWKHDPSVHYPITIVANTMTVNIVSVPPSCLTYVLQTAKRLWFQFAEPGSQKNSSKLLCKKIPIALSHCTI